MRTIIPFKLVSLPEFLQICVILPIVSDRISVSTNHSYVVVVAEVVVEVVEVVVDDTVEMEYFKLEKNVMWQVEHLGVNLANSVHSPIQGRTLLLLSG